MLPALRIWTRCGSLPCQVVRLAAAHRSFATANDQIEKFTKVEIDMKVLDKLYEYAKCYPEKVKLEANMTKDLLMDKYDRYGLQWDIQNIFNFDSEDYHTFASGKEYADWIASFLEEEGRLKF